MSSERFREIFFEIFSQYVSDTAKIEKMYADVVKRYSAKNRYYHDINHIHCMVGLWEKYKSQLEYPNFVFLAIIYHDIIYKVKISDSEEQSASYFVKVGSKNLNLSASEINHISHIILYTKHNCFYADKLHLDTQFLLDFDLSALSSSKEEYENYYNNIRKEYRIYPNFIYKKGRLDFLQKFLNKQNIYLTEEFSKFEKIARNNIQNEIIYLSSSNKRK